MKVRFLSANRHKIDEVKAILTPLGIEAIAVDRKIEEIQTSDVDALLRQKAIRAFTIIGRPLFVEHTGLYTDALNGFPGGLTQVFWDTIGAVKVCEMFKSLGNQRVIAKTHVGYIDGRDISVFSGEVHGKFSDEPKGPADFQWDCVFIPDGFSKTFAEMGVDEKNRISMRRIALDAFAKGVSARVR